MLHDACDMHIGAITQRVNITFHRAGKITVQQNWAIARDHHRLFYIAFELGHIAHDLHRPPPQNIGRPDH